MNGAIKLLAFVTAQRAGELLLARRNTRALLAAGAYETGAEHYPAIVALHAAWLGTLWVFGRRRPVRTPFAAIFLMLQLARVWILASLGPRWTTRIIIVPGAAPVTRGPYRFLRHPNYTLVACELPCASLALGLKRHAVLFAGLNLAVLSWRVRVENRALAQARSSLRRS